MHRSKTRAIFAKAADDFQAARAAGRRFKLQRDIARQLAAIYHVSNLERTVKLRAVNSFNLRPPTDFTVQK
eukprot:12378210-Alexandrium_andersonii.AAC.1